ncbi:unnamed protein product [Protopolystoma xenopodis]|uniref:Uncharacterized protein n=1 Tax=Protopolystoma xenopodis TaxID=117903 RepID=A0A3S5FFS8_9PLAT|nr:unnamed protein product [Protopolystoma xenopodis]
MYQRCDVIRVCISKKNSFKWICELASAESEEGVFWCKDRWVGQKSPQFTILRLASCDPEEGIFRLFYDDRHHHSERAYFTKNRTDRLNQH